jgi:hypothetical protein
MSYPRRMGFFTGLRAKEVGEPLDVSPLSDAEIDALLEEGRRSHNGDQIAEDSMFLPRRLPLLMLRLIATVQELRDRPK